MALDLSPANLAQEARSALRYRRLITDASVRLIKQYHGQAWRTSDRGDSDALSHENHSWEYICNTQPALLYYNPAFTVKSRRPQQFGPVADHVEGGLNQWVHDVDLANLLHQPTQDMFFDYGVTLTVLEPVPGMEGAAAAGMQVPMWPMVHRISPRRFFMDPQASHWTLSRYMGHFWLRDRADLMSDPHFDQAAVRGCPSADTWTNRRDGSDDLRALGIDRVNRDQVLGVDMWIPEANTIITMAASAGVEEAIGTMLRPPRPAFCPPWGPYLLWGLFWVPDHPYPLAPLAVTAQEVEDINAHLDAVRRQWDQARSMTFVNTADSRLRQILKTGRDTGIFGIPGFDRSMLNTVTVGAPDGQQLAYVQFKTDKLDRKTGISNTERGDLSGDPTATAVDRAAQASETRKHYMQSRYRQLVKRQGETVSFYLCESPVVIFDMAKPRSQVQGGPMFPSGQSQGSGGEGQGEQAGDPMAAMGQGMQGGGGEGADEQMVDGLFMGGPQPGQEGFTYRMLALDVEPMSMEWQDPQARAQKGLAVFQVVTQGAQLMPLMPFVQWMPLMEDTLNKMGEPGAADKYFNWPMLGMAQMMQLQQQAMAGGGAPGGGQGGASPAGPPQQPGRALPPGGNRAGGSTRNNPAGRQTPQQPARSPQGRAKQAAVKSGAPMAGRPGDTAR